MKGCIKVFWWDIEHWLARFRLQGALDSELQKPLALIAKRLGGHPMRREETSAKHPHRIQLK